MGTTPAESSRDPSENLDFVEATGAVATLMPHRTVTSRRIDDETGATVAKNQVLLRADGVIAVVYVLTGGRLGSVLVG